MDQAFENPNVFQQVTRDDVERAVAAFTHEHPEEPDIQRVALRLGSLAWSIDDHEQTTPAPIP